MPREIQIKEGQPKVFSDEEPSWLALDLPEIKPPIYAYAFIVFLGLFFLTALVYSAFTTVPVIVESTGKIITEKPPVPVRALGGFTVDQILVRESQEVRAEQILVTSSDGLKKDEIMVVNALMKEFNFISSQRPDDLCRECMTSMRNVSNAYPRLKSRSQLAQLFRPLLDQTTQLSETLLKIRKIDPKLQPSRAEWAKLNKLLTAYQKATPTPANLAQIQKIKKLLEPLQQRMGAELRPYVEALNKNIYTFREATKDIQVNIDQFTKMHAVKAPFDGRIINLKLKGSGELVGAGQFLMEVVPLNNSLIAAVDVLNRDIGTIQVNDVAEITFDAYPEMDYGHVNGRVIEILPADVSDNGQPNSYQEKSFKVHVSIDEQGFTAKNKNYKLLPGMTMRSRVIKRQETLLRTFYRSIFKIKEDLKVRN